MTTRHAMRIGVLLLMTAGAAAACLFPTEEGGQYRIVLTKPVGLLFLGDTARVEAVVVDGDGTARPDITVNYRSELPEVVEVEPRTGLLRGVQEGEAVVLAFAPGWEQAVPAPDTVRVLLGSGSGIVSYEPRTARFGDTLTIVGDDLSPAGLASLVFGGIGYDSAGIVHRFAAADRDTLVLWALPPAPEATSVLLVRNGGSAVVLPVQMEQADILEPNSDAAPAALSLPFRNPGLTVGLGDIDVFRVPVEAGARVTATVTADPEAGVELSVRRVSSGSAIWPASTRTWCRGANIFSSVRDWQVERQRVAIRNSGADTLLLRVVGRGAQVGELIRYELALDTTYVSAVAPDDAEENDWCETALPLPTMVAGDSVTTVDTSLALSFDNAPDLDWLRLDLDRARVVTVSATSDSTAPAPDFYLFREAGDTLLLRGQRAAHDSATAGLDSLAISLEAGPYLLLVTNAGVGDPASAVGTYRVDMRSELPVVADVTLDRQRVAMRSGLETRLGAVVTDQIGTLLSGTALTWSSADTTVATVEPNGNVTGFITAEGTDSTWVTARSTDFPEAVDSALIVVVRDDVVWTWLSGSSAPNQSGVYGTMGVASAENIPGARTGAMSWTDAAGVFWLFGGAGYDASGTVGPLNDLWRFDGVTWTWVGGTPTARALGVYGTQGQADPANVPGGRYGSVTWVDSFGNLWLFGGFGMGASDEGHLNDLWRFDGTTWTWVDGSTEVNRLTLIQPSGSNPARPGGRVGAVAWIDAQDRLFLFGGEGRADVETVGWLDDLWWFDGTEWVSRGLGFLNFSGNYSALGNIGSPGGRWAPAGWQDAAGGFWLFGGEGVGSPPFLAANGTGRLNDLWRFDGSGAARWISGDSIPNREAVYGLGVATDSTDPGGRSVRPVGWVDAGDNLWLFGGSGVIDGVAGSLNDLWRFDGVRWTWMSGSRGVNKNGVYGTLGVGSLANVPGGRDAAASWTDSQGNFWLFGGASDAGGGNLNFWNDLWKVEP